MSAGSWLPVLQDGLSIPLSCVMQSKKNARLHVNLLWCKKNTFFQIIVTFFIFNIKKNMLTPKQPVINAVLITYIDYSITENYIRKMASFLPYTRPEPLLKVLHHIY